MDSGLVPKPAIGPATSGRTRWARPGMTDLLHPAHRYAKSEVMPTDPTSQQPAAGSAAPGEAGEKRRLTPTAERALAEAAARCAERDRNAGADAPKEKAGRSGLDPTRYGDWEVNGLTSDF